MEIASDVKPNPELPIVGIGASAGGLESFVQLLSGLSGDNGFAIIFVQHLDPNHPSLASEIIGRATKMAVREIRDGDVAEVNHVYALPPNFDLTISKGILKLHPRRSSTSSHRPIDAFFQSLALDKGVRAMGVVLSGTATDGTEGLLSIKAECRITFAQTPESAKFDGMPKAAIDAGVVDLTCDPKAIAEELLQITKDTSIAPPKNSDKGKDEDPLEEIVALLWKYNSVDFTDYKKTTLKRRIARRMIILKQASEKSYATFLADNPEEVKILFAEILIHVTSFFRDADEFAALSAQAFPAIVKSHADGSPIRIWVAGCSTGEEAYSIAISILEFLGDRAGSQAIEIFASDISDSAIQVARQGIYSEISAKNIPEALLARYFTKCAEGYKVNKAVRELCLFSKHDVTADPPFARVDLISCRNLLIYFTPALQKRAFPIFHYALRPDGFLFLGHSESVGAFANLFQAAQGNHKIFLKKAGPAVLPRMHFSPGRNTSELTYGVSKSVPQFKSGFDSQREADRIVALKYGPSGVVVNEDLEILGFRGRTVPYLEQPSGSASRQLLKMANPDLAAELRSLLNAVKKQPLPVRKENLILGSVAQSERLNIEVIPLNSALPTSERQYLVLFEKVLPLDGGAVPTAPKTATPDDSIFEQRILQLELQLSSSKEYQQTLAEDHESAQEEVSAANEELQSTNEELTTVNDELQNSNGELAHLSNDLINLLSSIEIPMIIVGADHKIRRFTTTATKVLSLVQTDIGRSILDIRSNLKLSNLDTLISEVMDTLKIKEIEVQDHQGHWYRLQIRPYETSDHKIDGAVLSFVDIEVLKQALGRMKLALGHATSISEALQMPSMIVDRELKVRSVNQLFCKIFNLTAAATEGKDLAAIANKNWNGTELTKLLQDTVLVKKAFRDFELSGDFAGIGKRTYLLSAREFRWIDVPETEPESILITIFDITERKNIELALEESELTYRTILESAHDSIVAVDDKGIIKIANSQTEKWFGYPRGELLGKNFEILIPNAFRQSHAKLHKDYLAQPTARAMAERSSLSGQRKDGTTFPIEVSLSPVKMSQGLLVIAVLRDVTFRRQIEDERGSLLKSEKSAREEAEKANRAKDLFLATLSHELRTPLSSILTWAQLIRHGKVDLAQAQVGAEVIEKSAKTQSQLIDDLLDISRIIAGKLAIEITEVELHDVILFAVESVRALAEKKSIRIETILSPEVGIILANPVRIQQIIWNLLTNAIKFSPKGSKIEVHYIYSGTAPKRFAQIKVIDQGKGIAAEFLPHIFNRFSQADSTSTRLHGGLGLGLSIVSSLVQLQGGVIKVENSATGTGAIFTVTFPLPASVSAIIQTESGIGKDLEHFGDKQKKELPSLEKYRVLVVDDDEATRESMAIYLRSFGAEVLLTESAEETLKKISQFKPHILVSDIAMPDVDGYELMRRVRALRAKDGGTVPALALTAFNSLDDAKQALDAGFQAHYAKPVEANELARAISKFANKPENSI